MTQPFAGFAAPTSNTTYTPNQFFDVCLPHYSRGCVRLVGYLIRKTLGWSDEHGRPQAEQHALSYQEIQAKAGIHRSKIKPAIDEAIAGKFIQCARAPQAKKAGQQAVTGLYELRWDERPEYLKDPKAFAGFFAGEGNRTYIPNAFFDLVLPQETLAVVKVVGSVIRFSIGFATKWGHRRRNVALSFQHMQNYARLGDRKSLSAAVKHALASNYIERVEEGYFDPDGGRLSRAAVYALKWAQAPLNQAADDLIGRKTPPAKIETENQSPNPTGIGRKTPPAHRSQNPTDIEITDTNNTLKQQLAVTSRRLREAGFDPVAAEKLASKYPAERIERQIQWLPQRSVRKNGLGMLRLAIEQDWSAPAGKGKLSPPNRGARTSGASFGDAIEQARRRLEQASSSSPS